MIAAIKSSEVRSEEEAKRNGGHDWSLF